MNLLFLDLRPKLLAASVVLFIPDSPLSINSGTPKLLPSSRTYAITPSSPIRQKTDVKNKLPQSSKSMSQFKLKSIRKKLLWIKVPDTFIQ